MFAAPNKKGFENVTHFLFSKLSLVTHIDYKLPWPLISKECDRKFQKICIDHLSKFAQENVVRFPRLVPSILSTYGGERFYEVYFAFSTYVLSKTMEAKGMEFMGRPVIKKENFKTAEEILQLSIKLAGQRFKDIQSVTHANNQIWIKTANDFVHCSEDLKENIKTSEALLYQLMENLHLAVGGTPGQKLKWSRVTEEILKLSKPDERRALLKFFLKETKLWNMLASKLSEDEEGLILDGEHLNISIAEDCPDYFKSELKKTGFTTSEVDGKLSITKFVRLLRIYIKLVTEVLKKAEFNKLLEDFSKEDVNNIHASLKDVAQLIKKVSENDILELEKSVKELKSNIHLDDSSNKVGLDHEYYIPLPNLSFNPEAIRARVSHFEPGELFEFTGSAERSQDSAFVHSSSNYNMKINPNTPPSEELMSADLFLDSKSCSTSQITVGSEVSPTRLDMSLLQRSWLEDECLFSISNPNISFDDL